MIGLIQAFMYLIGAFGIFLALEFTSMGSTSFLAVIYYILALMIFAGSIGLMYLGYRSRPKPKTQKIVPL